LRTGKNPIADDSAKHVLKGWGMIKVLGLALLLLSFFACGKKGSTENDGAAGYARLESCDTLNWLGLPDSVSCSRSGGLCPIPGMDKVGINACLVGNAAYVYSVVSGVAFASETRADLNGQLLKGPGTAVLKFDSLRARNELKVDVEYSTTLADTAPIVYSRTYRFSAP
jgi:hypothetical protein